MNSAWFLHQSNRWIAGLLAAAIFIPAPPAFALRAAGVEQPSVRAKIQERLEQAAGAEETDQFFRTMELLGLETTGSIVEALVAAGYRGAGWSSPGGEELSSVMVNEWRREGLPLEVSRKLPDIYKSRARKYFFPRMALLGLKSDGSIANALLEAGYTGAGRSGSRGESLSNTTVNQWRTWRTSLPLEALEKLPTIARERFFRQMALLGLKTDGSIAGVFTRAGFTGAGPVLTGGIVSQWRTGRTTLPLEALQKLPIIVREGFFRQIALLGMETGDPIAEALVAAGYTGAGRGGLHSKGLRGLTVIQWWKGVRSFPLEALEKLPVVYDSRAAEYFFGRMALLGLRSNRAIAMALTAAGYRWPARREGHREVRNWRKKSPLPSEALEKLPIIYESRVRGYFFGQMAFLGFKTYSSISKALVAAGYTGAGRGRQRAESLGKTTVKRWKDGAVSFPVEALEKLPIIAQKRFFGQMMLLGLRSNRAIAMALTAAGYRWPGRREGPDNGRSSEVRKWRGDSPLPSEALEKLPIIYESHAREYFFGQLALLGFKSDRSIARALTAAGYKGPRQWGRPSNGIGHQAVRNWKNKKSPLPSEALELLPRMIAAAAGAEEAPQAILERARRLLEEGNIQEAGRLAEELLRRDPTQVEAVQQLRHDIVAEVDRQIRERREGIVDRLAEAIHDLRLLERPPAGEVSSDEVVRAFIRQMSAEDGAPLDGALLAELTAHSRAPYSAGPFDRGDVQGRPQEQELLEGMIGQARSVLIHAGSQLELNAEQALAKLGWESLERFERFLYQARDEKADLFLRDIPAETMIRWFYRQIPQRLIPTLANRTIDRADLAAALANPFRLINEQGNRAVTELIQRLLAEGASISGRKLTADPEELAKDPSLVLPWIRLQMAANLVDYSNPKLLAAIDAEEGKDPAEKLTRALQRRVETPFVWGAYNEQDLMGYVRSVLQAARPAGEYVQEVVFADNNGQLVATLKLIEAKLSANPRLRVRLVLKGDNGVMNDASVEDAEALLRAEPDFFRVLLAYREGPEQRFQILRGPRSHGTPLDLVSAEVAEALLRADAVFIEGEANTVMLNGLRGNLYLSLRLKAPIVVRDVIGIEPEDLKDYPPLFMALRGGRYYDRVLASHGPEGGRWTIEDHWARPHRIRFTLRPGETVVGQLPTGEKLEIYFRKSKSNRRERVVMPAPIGWVHYRGRSLRGGAVGGYTLEKTGKILRIKEKEVQSGRRDLYEREVDLPSQGVYFLPLQTVRDLFQRQALMREWRVAAPYIFRFVHRLPDGRVEVELQYREPVTIVSETAAGAEEVTVRRALSISAEAVQGPGVVVIDAAMFPQQAGLEQFLAHMPPGRFIVVGAGSAAGSEAHARNPAVILAAGPVDAATAILALPARGKVYVFGGMDLTRLLQLYLRDFLIEVSQLDLRLGLKGILLALGVPEEVLRQLDWASVESTLSSLEAA